MRVGHKRSLSRKTPFDTVILVILAVVLSRAVSGSAVFFATLPVTADLDEDMRLRRTHGRAFHIRLARLERSGDISFIKNKLTDMAYDLTKLRDSWNEKGVDRADAQNRANSLNAPVMPARSDRRKEDHKFG